MISELLPITPEARSEADRLTSELMSVKNQLLLLGFLRSARSLDRTINEFGFEHAERTAFTDHGATVASDLIKVHDRFRKDQA